MPRDDDGFLRRWSRRKQDAAAQAADNRPAPAGEAPPLPSIDSLTFESDFKAFMHAKVEESVKRAALKKLFSDPRFNVMDGLDTYIDDYSKDDPLPPGMLAQLEHARTTLFGPGAQKEQEKEQDKAEPTTQDVAQAGEAPKKEDDGTAG